MSNGILSQLKARQVPLGVRQSAARGVLPVGQEELLAILILLQDDPEPQVSQTARETLANEFSDELLKRIVESDSTPLEVLEFFGRPPLRSNQILESLIQNKATPDSTIASLAERVAAGLMEVILINLMRLLRSPFILESLERNPNSTPDIKRRLKEIREEFFEKRNNFIPIHRTKAEDKALERAQAASAEEPEESTALVVYSEVIREGEDVTHLTLNSLADDGFGSFEEMGEEEKLSTIQKIARMTVAERVQTALKGNREERVILIRDANRIVASAVLESPKLTDTEVESIAVMKNVSEEVLRLVGTKREFAKSYTVIHSLVKNPRTPIGTSLTLLNRILTSDLRSLARNKNVPEVLRKTAQRQLQIRTAPRESK
ncbi:MAG: hypothetical protein DMG06_19335 [Acidobacteria bacterium]|nr:MAG: hypothetical protein DMG06_19335 [Acidobacteriota bacterium]